MLSSGLSYLNGRSLRGRKIRELLLKEKEGK